MSGVLKGLADSRLWRWKMWSPRPHGPSQRHSCLPWQARLCLPHSVSRLCGQINWTVIGSVLCPCQLQLSGGCPVVATNYPFMVAFSKSCQAFSFVPTRSSLCQHMSFDAMYSKSEYIGTYNAVFLDVVGAWQQLSSLLQATRSHRHDCLVASSPSQLAFDAVQFFTVSYQDLACCRTISFKALLYDIHIHGVVPFNLDATRIQLWPRTRARYEWANEQFIRPQF